jgi:hypothetical protein
VQEYEDRYKYTQRLILETRPKEEILGDRKPNIDVDFVTNTGMLDVP